MPGLVVISYADQGVAEDARRSVQELEDELAIKADRVSSISRDVEGRYHAHTSHAGARGGGGDSWSGLWEALFGLLFFDVRPPPGHLGQTGLSDLFQKRVRELVKPGTSAVFMVVEQAAPDKAVAALEPYGGIIIHAPLCTEEVEQLRIALRGPRAAEAAR